MFFYLALIETEEDRITFERLYRENKDRMYRIAFKYTKNRDDAEDAVQEVFYRIASKETKVFDIAEEKQSAYLNVITKHVAIDIFNNKNNKESLEFNDAIDSLTEISLEDEVVGKTNAEKLMEFIKNMPLGMREALYTKTLMGMSNSEAAEQLGISEEAYRQRLCAARKVIKEFINSQKGE